MPPFHPDDEEEWPDCSETNSRSPVRPQSNRAVRHLRNIWNPVPIPKPEIAYDLDQMSWPERTSEVIRFAVLGLEHWLSQGGLLREWIRLNLWAAILLTAVAILVIPPVTTILEGAAEWTQLGKAIIGNITEAILNLPPIAVSLATLFFLVKFVQRIWMKKRHERHHRQDDFEGYR